MFCPTGTHRYCCRIRESVERRGGYLREEHILAAQYYVTSERQETMLRKDDGLGLSLTPEGPVLRSRGLGLNSVPPQPHTDVLPVLLLCWPSAHGLPCLHSFQGQA